MIKKITVQTQQHAEAINVTQQLLDMVAGVSDGLAFFYVPHTTAALLINEDDQDLLDDFAKIAQNWLADCRPFAHVCKSNPNTEAHALGAFGGNSVIIPIDEGKPDLGTYQNILLLEMDGPKPRETRCKVIGN